jgi:fluoride exporter
VTAGSKSSDVTVVFIAIAAAAGVLARVGFLGGFTTFSTFSMQAVMEADGGRPGTALLYVTASVALGVVAAGAGYHAARAI